MRSSSREDRSPLLCCSGLSGERSCEVLLSVVVDKRLLVAGELWGVTVSP